jgi:hypothetical protein
MVQGDASLSTRAVAINRLPLSFDHEPQLRSLPINALGALTSLD